MNFWSSFESSLTFAHLVVSISSIVLYRAPKFALLKLFKLDLRVNLLALVRSDLLWSISQGANKLVPVDVTPHIACHLSILCKVMQDFFCFEFVDNAQSPVRRINIAAAIAVIMQVLFEDLEIHLDLPLLHSIKLHCRGLSRLNHMFVLAKLLTDSFVSKYKFVTH